MCSLREENSSLRLQHTSSIPELTPPDYQGIRDSEALLLRSAADGYLAKLKLGKQAPGYKAAAKALDYLISQIKGDTSS
jgi:hypothetical protein